MVGALHNSGDEKSAELIFSMESFSFRAQLISENPLSSFTCEIPYPKAQQHSPLTLEFPDLPVTDAIPDIELALATHQVVVIVGETGSGKTTQLPKLCLKLGRGQDKQIVHTQPRRLAARSVATRIADELKTDLGDLVGYQVRFERHSSDATCIKLVTDGLLLAEFRDDPLLMRYDTIIIDEAHERSLNIDFLLGILKTILPKRPDLKLIITSATINFEKFSEHFHGAPVIQVSGRTYPVEIRYHPIQDVDLTKLDGTRLAQAIHQAVFDLRAMDREQQRPMGDILVFLPGEREIRDVSQFLRQAAVDRLDVLPLYARLGAKEQTRIFQPQSQGLQRIVLATNVAETSLTVPGIRYVIDSGLARMSRYSARSRIQRLPIEPISQASANQRSGRCGRTEPGVAIRLFEEDDFKSRAEFTDAEILRTNLASVVLQCLDLELGDPIEFPFVDPPEAQLVRDGISQLRELDLVSAKGRLTALGRRVARLPLDPRIGRILIDAAERRVFWDVSVVASALSIQDPREAGFDDEAIQDPASEFVTLLNLWNRVEQSRDELSNSKFRQWCQSEKLNYNRLREWREVHRQTLISFRDQKQPSDPGDLDRIGFHTALLTGLASQIGYRDEHDYLGVRNRRFRVPKTAVHVKAHWVMAAELVETHRIIARTVAVIDPKWVVAAVPRLLKYAYAEPFWSKKQGRALCYRTTRLFGLALVEKEVVGYASIDAEHARNLMISEGLIGGEMRTSLPFMTHNKSVFAEASDIEAKLRRVDVMKSPDDMTGWFSSRFPESVADLRSLERWWKGASQKDRQALYLSLDDLKADPDAVIDTEHFPEQVSLGHLSLPASYQFAPGRDEDGVTVQVPLEALMQLKPEDLDKTVPGAIEEKVEAMLRALPKSIRRQLVPIPDFVGSIMPLINTDQGGLSESVARCVTKKTGMAVDPLIWSEQSLDARLQLRIEVIDTDGLVVDADRDLSALQTRLASRVKDVQVQAVEAVYPDWPVGLDLEPESKASIAGVSMKRFERFMIKPQGVVLTHLFDPKDALIQHREAVYELLVNRCQDLFRFLQSKEAGYQKGLVAVCVGEAAQDHFKRLLVASCLEPDLYVMRHADFLVAKQCVRERLVDQAKRIAVSLDSARTRERQLKQRLKGKIPPAWLTPITQMKTHLDTLCDDLLRTTPPDRLIDLDRYIHAIEIRLDKLQSRLLLDAQWQREIDEIETQLKQLWVTVPADWRLQDQNLVELRWQIEEFRVLCFAQTLKTRDKVSFKRLSNALKEYRKL